MIRVLFCGEREADWGVLQSFLYGSGSIAPRFHLIWERTLEGARAAVLQGLGDVYVIDEALGQGQGLDLLSLMPPSGATGSMLLLTSSGSLSEEALAIQAGAADVLNRDDLSPRLLRRAVVHATARAAVARRAAEVPVGLVGAATIQHRLGVALGRDRLARSSVALLAISVEASTEPAERVNAVAAERILGCAREVDTVSQAAPGHFLMLMEGLAHGAQADVYADRVLSTLEAPLTIQGRERRLRPSLGIAVAPEDADDAAGLLRRAEEALEQARSEGGRTVRRASAPLNEKAQRRWLLQRALEGALERNEFSLHFQPQIDLRTERVSGAEALLRWRSPHLGQVSPAEFVPLLEATSQIERVGFWVLQQACAQARRWEQGGMPIKVGVNASARQLTAPGFGEAFEQELRRLDLTPTLLGIEITEGLLLEGSREVRDLLTRIRSLGVSISVDDFGTGYASLSYIKRFPMDVIKIDREFVRGIPLDVENSAITSAILALGNSLGLKVVAEGVEQLSELEFLRSLGCNAVQGFYYAKPMPAREFEAWVHARHTQAEHEAFLR